jgi:hypothetical protein
LNDFLIDVFATYDSREKSLSRIDVFKEFIEQNGGSVERGTLQLCDYKLEGVFREKEINIGIEYKTLNDFSSSYQDLPDKLARSYDLYNDVALFIETPNFKVSSIDGFHATIVNPAVLDGSADVLNYAVLYNSIESWQTEGVHIRQLHTEMFMGYAISSVLINITKDTHRGLEISKSKDYKSAYLNCLSKIDGVGYKTAQKIAKYYPNFYWLSAYSGDDLIDKLGKSTGKKMYGFVHNKDLESIDWKNGYPSENKNTQNLEEIGSTSNEDSVGKGIVPKPQENTLNKKITELNNIEVKQIELLPSFKDVIEYVRFTPRKTEDVGSYFGFTPEYCLKALYKLKGERKIWFDKSCSMWTFGLDKTESKIKADQELDIGV